jgi:hypothetical protein
MWTLKGEFALQDEDFGLSVTHSDLRGDKKGVKKTR